MYSNYLSGEKLIGIDMMGGFKIIQCIKNPKQMPKRVKLKEQNTDKLLVAVLYIKFDQHYLLVH